MRSNWKGFFSFVNGRDNVYRSTYITKFMLGKKFIVLSGRRGKDIPFLVNIKAVNKKFGEFIFTRKPVIHKKKKKKK